MKLILLLVAYTLTAKCWWENGHMLVAQIAQIILKEENPDVFKRANQMVLAMGDLAYDFDNTFVTAACWADDIKSPSMSFWDSWHFYGRPVNPNGEYLRQDEIEENWNAVSALERAVFELDDSNGEDITLQKAIFIRFLIHIVGDVHQPLHSSNMFNATFDGPKGDLGGNMEVITDSQGVTERLHAFWDQGGEYFQTVGDNWIERPFSESTAILMEAWGAELMADYPKNFFGDLSENLDPNVWTRESWEFAANSTYPWVYEHDTLTEEYELQAQEICKQRVVLAGYRLANVLVDLYNDYVPTNIEGEQQVFKNSDNVDKEEIISSSLRGFMKQKSQIKQMEP